MTSPVDGISEHPTLDPYHLVDIVDDSDAEPDHVESILGTLNARDLFETAVYSETTYAWSSRFLKTAMQDASRLIPIVREPSDGTTSPPSLVAAHTMMRLICRILDIFDLDFYEVRLMQRATVTIAAGSMVTAVMPGVTTFEPDELDFITKLDSSSDVATFLERNDYSVSSSSSRLSHATGRGPIMVMAHSTSGRKINIFESLSNSPMDGFMAYPSSIYFGAWSADWFWHGYPESTLLGIAITTPTLASLSGTRTNTQRQLWKVIHDDMAKGFTYSLGEYPHPHTCGTDWNCPATPRRSDDNGCMRIALPPWLFEVEPLPHETVWSLRGTGCTAGILAGERPAMKALDAAEKNWTSIMSALIKADKIPEQFIHFLN
ncbi:hypothetical protein C8R43DRAFT_1116313 [Mycena crocata]|nr:hypothetical protein C8R43DRAFT_1116313 [Mycena crocata]